MYIAGLIVTSSIHKHTNSTLYWTPWKLSGFLLFLLPFPFPFVSFPTSSLCPVCLVCLSVLCVSEGVHLGVTCSTTSPIINLLLIPVIKTCIIKPWNYPSSISQIVRLPTAVLLSWQKNCHLLCSLCFRFGYFLCLLLMPAVDSR